MNNSFDENILNEILEQSGVNNYYDNLKFVIKNAITDLYITNWPLLRLIRIEHIDRAVFKYKESSSNKRIWNTKNYFKACLVSAVEEYGLDEH